MKRLKIFTWHVHGSYLYYLSQIPHDIFIPQGTFHQQNYIGITPSYPWPSNLHEIPVEQVKNEKFDCIIFQSHQNYLHDQHYMLSASQRELPRIYLEHDPPRETPTDTKHPISDPNVLIVHVTHFNKLMWDSGETPSKVIDHGVLIPEKINYTGELQRGIVLVNNLRKRGRRLGLDLFLHAKEKIPLDLYGMGWNEVGGKGELSFSELPYTCSKYRFFYNPIRYTSLGLSICEAMMIGLPIIGLATTELVSVIENEISGYLSTNPDELIIVGKELLNNVNLAREWGAAAQKKAYERFSIHRFINDWNNTLSQITNTKISAGVTLNLKDMEESAWISQS